jgi:hypothetical protein
VHRRRYCLCRRSFWNGSHVYSLVLTDIASGWTEAGALVVREQTLIAVKADEIRARLPFAMLGAVRQNAADEKRREEAQRRIQLI